MNLVYAHTKENCSEAEWELLYGDSGHAEKTAAIASQWATVFERRLRDADSWLRVLALYHDMGKAKGAFQSYLKGQGSSVSHKREAAAFFMANGEVQGRLLAYAFAGHHSGLPDGGDLFNRDLSHFQIGDDVMNALPPELRTPVVLQLPNFAGVENMEDLSVAFMLLVRMLHSCLVDADWLATEEFMQPEQALVRKKVGDMSLERLSERLEAFIKQREQQATGNINRLRKQIHERCYNAADASPGVRRLNVPTGGGKTLSSLSYALKHAAKNKLSRVIYVIPFTSIIEQTAGEFREVLGADNVVEHHSSIAEEQDNEKNRYATENWDAPVIVTTTVQFFETLYASRNKRCRKIHNIARSVIVFDEVQSLPPTMLAPCLAVLRELQRGYNCSLLLCTATQPTFENKGVFSIGWKQGDMQSVLGKDFERMLAESMKRVNVYRIGKMTQEKLIAHFLNQTQRSALFIVNLTREAQALFAALREAGIESLFHLSARMCPAHRREVLSVVRRRLEMGEPVVLVSTRVIEAGVDVSFPIVYRDRCGLDSLAQSAGRCNRHGEAEVGLVFAYEAEEPEYALPDVFVDTKNAVYAFEEVLGDEETVDITRAELIEAYFRAYYYRLEGGNMWDVKKVVAQCERGLKASCEWDFPGISQDFRMIDDAGRSLMVPFGQDAEKLRAELLTLQKIGAMPSRDMYRRLQQYSVTVYESEWRSLMKDCVHQAGEVYMLEEPGGYDAEMGLLRTTSEEKIYVL